MTKFWAIVEAISAFFGFLRGLMDRLHAAQDRQAGRDEANASTRAQNDARVKEAMEAEIEADKDHKSMPGDEAFDTEFRRD